MSNTGSPQANLQLIRQQLVDATQELSNLKMRRGESFRDFEYRTKELSDKVLSLKLAEQLQQQQIEQHIRAVEAELLKKKLLIYEEKSECRIQGWRPLNILFLGGNEIPIVSRFFATNKSRYKNSKGFYPGLMILGIAERVSQIKAESFLACWITIT